MRVRVSWGWGTGSPGIPQGYLCQSLLPVTLQPPHPPTTHNVSLVVVPSAPDPSSTTTATNETRCLVGGHSQLSRLLFIHCTHQRDTMSRWLSFSALLVPRQPPQPPTRHQCFVGGHSWLSQSLFNHHTHQRDTMSRWWSFSVLPVRDCRGYRKPRGKLMGFAGVGVRVGVSAPQQNPYPCHGSRVFSCLQKKKNFFCQVCWRVQIVIFILIFLYFGNRKYIFSIN